jgi:hypothetical protein
MLELLSKTHFIKNKYYYWYVSLVGRPKTTNTVTEKHHILPRSLGGSDQRENLIRLTLREHFLVHWLLTKFTSGPEKAKMIHAFWKMGHGRSLTSWQYELARRNYIDMLKDPILSAESRERMSKALKGRVFTEEWKRNLSIAAKKKPPVSVETRAKMSKSGKGKKQSEDMKRKLAETRTGMKMTDEAKQNMSDRWHQRDTFTCDFCGVETYKGNFNRRHGQNCLKNPDVDLRLWKNLGRCSGCGDLTTKDSFYRKHKKFCHSKFIAEEVS